MPRDKQPKPFSPFNLSDFLLFVLWGFVLAVVLSPFGVSTYISWILAIVGIAIYRTYRLSRPAKAQAGATRFSIFGKIVFGVYTALILVLGFATVFDYQTLISDTYLPTLPGWYHYYLISYCLVSLIALIAVWMKKTAGAYALGVSAIVLSLFDTYFFKFQKTVPASDIVSDIVVPLVLCLALYVERKKFIRA
jgi:hypothetical protein